MDRFFWIICFTLAPLIPDILIGTVYGVLHMEPDLILITRLSKISYALILLFYFFINHRQWRQFGLVGGLQIKAWYLLAPIWVIALFPLIEAGDTITQDSLIWGVITASAIGFGEEVTFRGLIFQQMAPLSIGSSILWSSLVFGAAHLIGLFIPTIDPRAILLQAMTASALGVLFIIVRLRTGSLWPGIVAHSVLDATALSVSDGDLNEIVHYSETGLFFQCAVTLIILGWSCIIWRSYRAAPR